MTVKIHRFIGGSVKDIAAHVTESEGGSFGSITGTPTCDGAGNLTLAYLTDVITMCGVTYAGAVRWMGAGALKFNDDNLGGKAKILRLVGAGGAADRYLYIVRTDNLTYTLAIYDGQATPALIVAGTTQFTWGTAYTFLAETDGTTLRVWFNSLTSAELTEANASGLSTQMVWGGIVTGATGTFVVTLPWQSSGAGGDQRPDPSTSGYQIDYPNGTPTTANTDQMTGDDTGTPGGGSKWLHVDDWNGGNKDTTTYLENPSTANSTFRQGFATPGGTFTKSVYCAAIMAYHENTVAAKTLSSYLFSADGTNKVEGPGTFLINSYSYQRLTQENAPGGSPWTQPDIANWEIGWRYDVATQACTLRGSAIQGEIMGFNLQAAAGGADRRRVLSQVC